jgi:serine phosphatase RsbU (regulator of sigma subunit)
MALLVRTRGTHNSKWVFPLKDCTSLGRHADCDIFDLFKEATGVSRRHAEIRLAGGQYVLEDKGSRNGTLLNGQRLGGAVPLRDGDRIDIGGVELTFCAGDDPAAEPRGEALDGVLTDEPTDQPRPLSRRAVAAPTPPAELAGYSAEKLRALAHMLQRLGRSLDIDQTLRELLAGLFAIFPQAERGFVAFADGPDALTPRASLFRPPDPEARLAVSRTIINEVLSRREAVLWSDDQPASDLVASASMAELEIRSFMSAPLLDAEGQPFGVVQIDSRHQRSGFTADDLEVMAGAVTQAAVAVRYARLYEEGLRRQAVERDLQLARQVQLSLLPGGSPPCQGYQFFSYYQTAYEVGGDYYDFIELPNNRLAVVVADVAGKGVSAALLMAKLSGELKYHLASESPRAAVARMNDSLCDGGSGRFVTLLLAVLDRAAPRLTLLNAGHPLPLRRRASGAVEEVGEAIRGTALGILPGRQYHELQVEVEPGDMWFAYTDGFTEAIDAREQMYGSERLRRQLARGPGNVTEAGEAIVREVQGFLGGQPQSDDMCLVGWGRLTVALSPPPRAPSLRDTLPVVPPRRGVDPPCS